MEAGPLDRPYRDEGSAPEPAFADEAPLPGDGVIGLGGVGAGIDSGIAIDGDDRGELADGLGLLGAVPGQQAPDEHALRPERRLRIWQTAPIVALGVLGSLMFAFPLAFDFGDQGAVVAMLGLLLSASSAGWGIMVARRVGYTWPGLPQRGSGGRPDWRFVAGYVLLCLLIGVLAVWRVARLH